MHSKPGRHCGIAGIRGMRMKYGHWPYATGWGYKKKSLISGSEHYVWMFSSD